MNKKTWLYLGFTIALLATVGSLFLSEVLKWTPCVLCWYQRTMLYPLVVVFGAAIIKEISNFEYIVWPLTIIGMLVAIFHNLLQFGVISEDLGPCVDGVSCITNYYLGFQFLTVPLLSLITFVVIAIIMIVYRKARV
jgi:disulfide bond formation protein DsbB